MNIKPYRTKDIIFNSHCDHFAYPGYFSFDFRVPDGKEYGVTYRFVGGHKRQPKNYVFDFIIKWCDPEASVDLSYEGIEVHPHEAEIELQKNWIFN